jgi:hypothetical protein
LKQATLKQLQELAEVVPGVLTLAAAKGNLEAASKLLLESGEQFLSPEDAPFKLKVISNIRSITANATTASYGCRIAFTNMTDQVRSIYNVQADVRDSKGKVRSLFQSQQVSCTVEPSGGSEEILLESQPITAFAGEMQLHSVTIDTRQDAKPFRYERLPRRTA